MQSKKDPNIQDIYFIHKDQSGQVAILLAVLVLSVVMIIGFGVSYILLNQIKMSSDIGKSVRAFYAADAGVEQCLFQAQFSTGACALVGGTITSSADPLSNGASFSATRADNNKIDSTGLFSNTFRKIEISW